jgi:NAD(P)-dependent dehydrogenase (short-subunit alcohol dehydrogenase family)
MMTEWNGWLPGGGPHDGLLKGQAALVAGGAGGIGEAVSRILAAAGAAIVVADFDAAKAAQVIESIKAAGGSASAVAADLRDEASVREAVDAAARAQGGGFDILANIAGGMHAHAPWAPLTETTTESWDAVTQINLRYVFWTCRAAIPVLEERGGGAIVNVGSVAALSASPGQSAYGAGKAAVLQLTKTLAVECGPAKIRVNAVSPGVTLTPPARKALASETGDAYRAATPLRALGVPEDIARAVLFFASPMSAHITGQDLTVDGGISANFPYAGLGGH